MPDNEFNNWKNGFQFQGVENGTNDNGEMIYWKNGFPFKSVFITTTPPPSGTARNFGFIIG